MPLVNGITLHPTEVTAPVKNILRKRFYTYFFTHIHLMVCLASAVNLIAVMTLLLTSGLHGCKQRIFKKNTNYFYAVRISISLAILSEFSFKLVTFATRCYA